MMPETQTPNYSTAIGTGANGGFNYGSGQYNAPGLAGGNLASGDGGINSTTQGLINTQVGRALNPNDTNQLMEGVGSAANGLLKDSQSEASMGGGNPDVSQALEQANASKVGNTVANIQTYLNATAPIRQAQREQDAESSLAKVAQLDYNDYMLSNQQELQTLQYQQAQEAAQQGFLGGLLGLVGTALGVGVGAALAPATGGLSLAGSAALGGMVGSKAGSAAGTALGGH